MGFVHGVMNTDNMTISGNRDYGPCAFMDTYDPKTVFSSIDRWPLAYKNQPHCSVESGWVAETLLPLISNDKGGYIFGRRGLS